MASDFFDSLESQLVEAARHGEVSPVRRVRKRIVRWVSTRLMAAIIAVTVAAGGITAGLTGPLANLANDHAGVNVPATAAHDRAHAQSSAAVQTPPPPLSIPSGGPVPPGFQPQSFTAISEFTWWMMGPAPCSSPPCTSIVRTVNGGVSFVGLHAPRTTKVANLRFADEYDGYAFGPQLWATHDGGQTWRRVRMHGTVESLAAAYPYVFAVLSHRGHSVLMRSPVSVDTWKRVGPANVFAGLWVNGSSVFIDTQSPTGGGQDLWISHDRGAHFQQAAAAPPSVACGFDATPDGGLWAPCITGMQSGVWHSTDGGMTFTAVLGGGSTGTALSMPNSAAFGAASAATAVIGSRQLYRTTNQGRTWSQVPNVPRAETWTYVGFTDATHGVAIGRFGTGSSTGWRLYYTTDAGASYHDVPINP